MSEINKSFQPVITGRPGAAQKPAAGKPLQNTGASFGDLLQRTLEQQQAQTAAQPVTFSKHAQERSLQRGIQLTDTELDKLSAAVGKASDKGVTDTLVFMDNKAFIVNVPNKVVVTVVDGSEAESNVFTNINGAVII